MGDPSMKAIQSIFSTRLDTLEHLLKKGEETFNSSAFLEYRIAPDMATFGTQVAFTCNQPRNFALWCQGQQVENLDPNVITLERAHGYIRDTKQLLLSVPAEDAKLDATTRVDLGPSLYAEMSGRAYVHDFLIPNFYFHLVTAYDILRMAGVSIGKRDYMLHLLPVVRQG